MKKNFHYEIFDSEDVACQFMYDKLVTDRKM